ncbi:G-protein coupled receptor 35-like [Rhincodon typus]|uniref:G-protein coupled receptor 35-like n=1 Tax=Rhincodon typus TaxID=259920 RepID=UPI00202E3559|nr:G-protein coupled receptor 35-like [Rhincodon typus]
MTGNTTVHCNDSMTKEMHLILIGISVPIFFLGLTFNAMTLWAFCCKFRKWTETIIFVTNPAVSDSILLLILPFKMYSYRTTWNLRSSYCTVLECLYFVNMYVSIYIIVCITVDRYIAIKYPFKAKYLRSPKKATFACGAAWTLICSLSVFLKINFNNATGNNKFCFQKTTAQPTKTWIIISIELFGFVIPFLILSFCSFQIIVTLCNKSAESQGNYVFGRSIKIVITNLIIFFICFMPFHAGLLHEFLQEMSHQDCKLLNNVRLFMSVASTIASINCCLDGIIYYFASIETREFLNQTKKEVNNVNAYTISFQKTQDAWQSGIQ